MKFNFARTLKGLTKIQLKEKRVSLEKESNQLWDNYFINEDSQTLASYNRVNRYIGQIDKKL